MCQYHETDALNRTQVWVFFYEVHTIDAAGNSVL